MHKNTDSEHYAGNVPFNKNKFDLNVKLTGITFPIPVNTR